MTANSRPSRASLFTVRRRKGDTLYFERCLVRSGFSAVAGVDEAGRGPLAGPVVAGCVILPARCRHKRFKDSKVLAEPAREELFAYLGTCGAVIGHGIVSHEEIDRTDILQASLLAMSLAIEQVAAQLESGPDYLLVDGTFQAPVALPQETLVKGESQSASIAAASIVAKVVRDRLMLDYHDSYPGYDFHLNKGYATAVHMECIRRRGPCPIHRRTFNGVREHLPGAEADEDRQARLW